MLRREKKADARGLDSKERRRFRIAKLEERIAPKKNGWNNPNNPHYTGNCTETCFCSVY